MLFRSDRKSTRLNSSHLVISYAVFCLKKKQTTTHRTFVNRAADSSHWHATGRGGPGPGQRGTTRGAARRPRSGGRAAARFFFFNGRRAPEILPSSPPRLFPR